MKTKNSKVKFFDTTLRDGGQTGGVDFSIADKVAIARAAYSLGIDIIEVGFPTSGRQDFDAVQTVAATVPIKVCALARCVKKDIDRAGATLSGSLVKGRIHVFIATSKIHMEEKLNMTEDEVVAAAVTGVLQAKSYVDDVEFSLEDAGRSEFDFMVRVINAVVKAGATTINIPDTTGYSVPAEFGETIRKICALPTIKEHNVTVSVHCHDDLGMAVANTLAAIKNGARQAECTVNGLGERAGNTHYAEVAMAIKTRPDYYNVECNIVTPQIGPTALLVAERSGVSIPYNKAVVGKNAFSHASGIHQHGVSKSRKTYEIMTPESVGWDETKFPLTKQSGSRGVMDRLKDLGYPVNDAVSQGIYKRFMEVAETRQEVPNSALHMIMQEILAEASKEDPRWIEIVDVDYHKTGSAHSGLVHLKVAEKTFEASATGVGSVDATGKAVEVALRREGYWPCEVVLDDFDVRNDEGGTDALGLSEVKISCNGHIAYGRGAHVDIIKAYAKAMIMALNHLIFVPIVKEE